MTAFEKQGPVNTEKALDTALKTAMDRGLDIVIATSTGSTALKLTKKAKEIGFKNNISAVTLAYGFKTPGKNEVSEEKMEMLKQNGVNIVTAAHALSGAERSISRAFGGASPVEIMAYTLKMMGQGVKVCVETSVMALDNGSIEFGKPVVCVAGSSSGADTVCIITPAYSANILNTRIHEIICKPSLLG